MKRCSDCVYALKNEFFDYIYCPWREERIEDMSFAAELDCEDFETEYEVEG